MPYGSWVNDLPTGFFLTVHIAAFVIGAGFAWLAFKRGLSLLGSGVLALRRRRARLSDVPPRLDGLPVRTHHRRGARPERIRARVRRGGLRDGAPARPRSDELDADGPGSSPAGGGGARGDARRGGLQPPRARSAPVAHEPGDDGQELSGSTRTRSRSRPARPLTWTNDDNFTHTVQLRRAERPQGRPR